MTFKTKGIVLKSVKYGETSLIATILTELFGMQTYMVNGARNVKKGSTKALMLQPGSILELEVYHNELKNLQRIKEMQWGYIYETLMSDIMKNSIASYFIELILKTIKQPEKNEALYNFSEDVLMQLDVADNTVAVNMPLFISLQLPSFFGFKIEDPPVDHTSCTSIFLDLSTGRFSKEDPGHIHTISGQAAAITMELLKAMQPIDLTEIKLNKQIRRELLHNYLKYYTLHFPDFGEMKTLKVFEAM
ncbi:MAG: DNA repair protein RecO [Ferruginibacter sp.]|nr:DNA repair protein RecO [Ferruginibacter sp.]